MSDLAESSRTSVQQGENRVNDENIEDDAAFLMMMAEEEIGDPTTHGAEHPVTKRVRESLLELYDDTEEDCRKLASEAYPWLVKRFRTVPEYNKFWQEHQRQAHPEAPFILNNPSNSCSLHPVFTSIHTINNQEVSGIELLVAVAFTINPNLKIPVASAVRSDTSIPVSDLGVICGDADPRNTRSVGVYVLTSAQGKIVVGHTISRGFKKRLDSPYYSGSKRVVAEMGKANEDDQRVGRTDRIIFDLGHLEDFCFDLRWLSMGLESLAMIMLDSTNPEVGMNTRAADPGQIFRGMTPQQILRLWTAVRNLTDQGLQIPVLTHRNPKDPNGFHVWYRKHLEPVLGLSKTPAAQSVYARLIEISALADTGDYVAFPRLRDGAFVQGQRPMIRGNREKVFEYHRRARLGYERLPPVQSLDKTLEKLIDKIDTSALADKILNDRPDFKISERVRITVRPAARRKRQMRVVDRDDDDDGDEEAFEEGAKEEEEEVEEEEEEGEEEEEDDAISVD
nr:uncharacterized protein CI109_002210 [Kwoniella shandongensis]KAA5529317.1 hypothetical protein CI109_002210 [Kwoniella shandongensis]